MALIACPECGQTITSDAVSCLHCGTRIESTAERLDYVTGEPVTIMPRPAAQLAPRPFRYPSSIGLGLMGGGALVIVLGSFLPWVRLGPRSVSGLSGVGPITLALGLAMALLALGARTSTSVLPRWLVLAGGVAAILVAVVDTSRTMDGALALGRMGFGLLLVLVGGVAAVSGSFLRER